MPENSFSMIRQVPYMGVIWVVHEASKLGFYNGHPDWCNLGQGQPEVGELPDAPERINAIALQNGDHAYGPLGGSIEVRKAIAAEFNSRYRTGLKSQYTAANVCFASGGRQALTRLFAILADGTHILSKIPDYTAYEDYLAYHKHRCPITPIRAGKESGFSLTANDFEIAVRDLGIGAFVFSNPANPTGEVISGQELGKYVETARKYNCLLGCDEFYSHFVYNEDGSPASGPVSAAAHVEDVEKDPVLIIDGLTKNHRYPGWRAGWIIGPSHCIEMLNRAGSALDGGPSLLVQRAVLEAMQPERFERETTAMRAEFAHKRRLMLQRLAAMGINTARAPLGTFYVWADISALPAPLNNADAFFHACLKSKVMTVPGRFFDLRPYGARPAVEPFCSLVRLSYGPSMATVTEGLSRMESLIAEHSQGLSLNK